MLHQELDGSKESVEVEEERDQNTDAHVVRNHHGAADAEEQSLAQDSNSNGRRTVGGVDAAGVHVRVAIVAHHISVVDDVETLAVIGRHHSNPIEGLGEIGENAGNGISAADVSRLTSTVKPDGEQGQNRHYEDQGPKRQGHVHGEHHRHNDDHGQALLSKGRDAVLQQLLKVLDVTRHTAHQDADLFLGEKVETEPL